MVFLLFILNIAVVEFKSCLLKARKSSVYITTSFNVLCNKENNI